MAVCPPLLLPPLQAEHWAARVERASKHMGVAQTKLREGLGMMKRALSVNNAKLVVRSLCCLVSVVRCPLSAEC